MRTIVNGTGGLASPSAPSEANLERPLSHAEEALATLAALLQPVLPDPLAAAAQLLHRFGSVGRVLVASERSLMSVPGLTATATRLLSAAHAATAFALREPVQRDVIADGTTLNKWLRAELAFCYVERALGLFLDKKNGLIRCEVLAEGSINHVPLYPREVAIRALELQASAVILAHKHPSGDPMPSMLDQQTTRETAAALLTIGVVLHDHVIVGRERIVSMRALGAL
jgi:DNA repair protein RadC